MPISYVGAGTAWKQTGSLTTYDLNCPGDLEDGDLLIAILFTGQDTTVTPHTGWTLRSSYNLDDGAQDHGCFVMLRDALASDSGTTFNTGGGLTDAAGRRMSVVWAYRGAAVAAEQFVYENGQMDPTAAATRATPVVENLCEGAWRTEAYQWRATGEGGVIIDGYDPDDTELARDEVGTATPWLMMAVAHSGVPIATGNTSVSATYTPGAIGVVENSFAWIGIIKPIMPPEPMGGMVIS